MDTCLRRYLRVVGMALTFNRITYLRPNLLTFRAAGLA